MGEGRREGFYDEAREDFEGQISDLRARRELCEQIYAIGKIFRDSNEDYIIVPAEKKRRERQLENLLLKGVLTDWQYLDHIRLKKDYGA